MPFPDVGLAHLGALPKLRQLNLSATEITDKGLVNLKGLTNLEYLNLYGTAVTDAGLANLEGMKKLQHLYLWQTKATDTTGQLKLAYDRPGTWSQKYNLVWDRLLGLHIFPKEVALRETAYYQTKLNPFGLPLDGREVYTKLDWETWTATLAADDSYTREIGMMRAVGMSRRQVLVAAEQPLSELLLVRAADPRIDGA